MRNLFQNFKKDESGATLVEYGVALIVAIVLGGGALSILAEETGLNMDAACGSLGNGLVLAEGGAGGECASDGEANG